MIVVMNRIPVKPEHRGVFEARFRNRTREIDRFPGFIRNLVLRPTSEDNPYYVIMTFWESQEAFEAWVNSEAFEKAHRRARTETKPEWFQGRNVFEMYEVVTDTDATL